MMPRLSHMNWSLMLLAAAWTGACASSTPAPASPAEPAPASTPSVEVAQASDGPGETAAAADDGGSDCPRQGGAAAQHEYEEGVRLLEASRDGEHYLAKPFGEAMAHLRRAAEAGHTDAQFLFGSTKFSAMFTAEAPRADQENDYVKALASLLRAARRGHAKARSYLPALLGLELDAQGKITPTPQEPLDSLPEPWLVRVLKEADSLGGCPDAAHADPE